MSFIIPDGPIEDKPVMRECPHCLKLYTVEHVRSEGGRRIYLCKNCKKESSFQQRDGLKEKESGGDCSPPPSAFCFPPSVC